MTADRGYGADHALRCWLQDHAWGYVLAVTKAQRLGFGRVEGPVGEVPPQGWHRRSAGDTRAELGMAPQNLLENGDRPQPWRRLEDRHDLTLPDIGERIGAAAFVTDLPLRGRRRPF